MLTTVAVEKFNFCSHDGMISTDKLWKAFKEKCDNNQCLISIFMISPNDGGSKNCYFRWKFSVLRICSLRKNLFFIFNGGTKTTLNEFFCIRSYLFCLRPIVPHVVELLVVRQKFRKKLIPK